MRDALPRDLRKPRRSLTIISERPHRRILSLSQHRRPYKHMIQPTLLDLRIHNVVILKLMLHVRSPQDGTKEAEQVRRRVRNTEGRHGNDLGDAVLPHHGGDIGVRVGHHARWGERRGKGAVGYAGGVEGHDDGIWPSWCKK